MSEDRNAALNMAMMAGGMYGPNPYSQFPNGIQGSSYNGPVTDAMGRPIAPPPGTTLNQTAAAPQAAKPQGQGIYGDPTLGLSFAALAPPSPGGPSTQAQWAYNLGLGGLGSSKSINPGSAQGRDIMAQAAQSQQPTQTQTQTTQPANSYQNALNLLANPGKPDQPGATVPQNPSINNQPSVLDQFLASGDKGGSGAGGYNNSPFFDTLNKLKGMSA